MAQKHKIAIHLPRFHPGHRGCSAQRLRGFRRVPARRRRRRQRRRPRHLLARRRNLRDGANRHHLRRHRRRDDLLTPPTERRPPLPQVSTPARSPFRRLRLPRPSRLSPWPRATQTPRRIRRLYDDNAPPATPAVMEPIVGWLTQLESMGIPGPIHRRIRKRAADSQESWREHHPHPDFCESHHHRRRLGRGGQRSGRQHRAGPTGQFDGLQDRDRLHYSDTWADPGHQTTPARGRVIAMPNCKPTSTTTPMASWPRWRRTESIRNMCRWATRSTPECSGPSVRLAPQPQTADNFTQVTGLINSGYSAVKAVSTHHASRHPHCRNQRSQRL